MVDVVAHAAHVVADVSDDTAAVVVHDDAVAAADTRLLSDGVRMRMKHVAESNVVVVDSGVAVVVAAAYVAVVVVACVVDVLVLVAFGIVLVVVVLQ